MAFAPQSNIALTVIERHQTQLQKRAERLGADLPEGSLIISIKKTPEGHEVRYLTPEQLRAGYRAQRIARREAISQWAEEQGYVMGSEFLDRVFRLGGAQAVSYAIAIGVRPSKVYESPDPELWKTKFWKTVAPSEPKKIAKIAAPTPEDYISAIPRGRIEQQSTMISRQEFLRTVMTIGNIEFVARLALEGVPSPEVEYFQVSPNWKKQLEKMWIGIQTEQYLLHAAKTQKPYKPPIAYAVADIPKGSIIKSYKETPQGITLQYLEPTKPQEPQPTKKKEPAPYTLEWLGKSTSKIVSPEVWGEVSWKLQKGAVNLLELQKQRSMPNFVQTFRVQRGDIKEYLWKGLVGTTERFKTESFKPISIFPFESPTLKSLKRAQAIQKYLEEMPQIGQIFQKGGGARPLVEALSFPSGFIGSIESWVRPEIPTTSGALVQTGITYLGTEQIPTYDVPLGYWAGSLLGEYLQAKYIFAPALERGWKGLKKVGGYVKGKLTSKTIETGFSRTALGLEGWQFETVTGQKGTPQFPQYIGWFPEEGWEDFFSQTSRATTRPVPIHIETEVPWKTFIKHPPTPKGGGLTETVVRKEILDFPKLAVRIGSRKTMLAPFLMQTTRKGFPGAMFIVFGTSALMKGAMATYPQATPLLQIKPSEVSRLKPFELERIFPSLTLTPIQEVKPSSIVSPKPFQIVGTPQEAKTVQLQQTRQLQRLKTATPEILREISLPRKPQKESKVKKKRRKGKRGKRGSMRKELWDYPVISAKEFARKYVA